MRLPMFPLRTQQHVVGENFFRVAGVPLMAGREFTTSDAAGKNIVVNDTFAGLAFRGQDPIGRRIQVGGLKGTWYTVIGVVQDIPITGLMTFRADNYTLVKSNRLGHEPAIYFHAAERPPAIFDVVTPRPVQLQMAGVITTARPRSDVIDDARAPARWFGWMLGALAAAAAIIAVLSLASMTLLNVKQHEIEIAARRAVGARRRDIVWMVVGANAQVAGRGVVVGVILSVAIARAIQMVWPEMRIFDWGTFAAATVMVTAVSLLAAAIPARAAAGVPPARVHV
jgi:putative ABC transport system permease protein